MRRKNRESEHMRRVAVYEDEENMQPRKRKILFPVLITLFSVIFVISAAVLVIELIVNPYVTDKNVGEIQEIYSEAGDTENAIKYGALNCFECGTCAYVCPARRPIVQNVRITKMRAKEMKK